MNPRAEHIRPNRILLLDDDALVRRAYERSARHLEGLELTTVATVEEAEALIHDAPWRFDVVVCDFWLGRGRAATEWIRQLHRSRVPVVVLTGDTSAAVEILGLRVPVFRKPLSLQELVNEVTALHATG